MNKIKLLTLDQLKEMPEHKMFATGVVVDSPKGINMTNSGHNLRWVAKRGHIHDWCIYVHWDYYGEEWIMNNGDKVHNEDHIRKLVPCNDEAFEMYRY